MKHDDRRAVQRPGKNPPRPARKTFDIPPAQRADAPAHSEGGANARTLPRRPGERADTRTLPVHPGERADARTLPVHPGERADARTLPVRPGKNSPRPAPGARAPREEEAFSGAWERPMQAEGAHHGPVSRFDGGRGPQAPEAPENLLAGRNPIREALKSGVPLEKLLVAEGDLSGAARDIARMAREAGVVVQYVERYRLDQIYPAHQGLLAFRSARAYATIEDILACARERGEDPLVVVLDQVTDPHNLGAIIRSAECAGAHGVVIPERRAAGLTPACEKAAAGALAHMRVARVKNLNRALEDLKRAGLWIAAAALEGENALTVDLTGPLALVIGSEGEGISRLTLSLCDRRVTLPMLGKIDSLNASVAAGVLLYQVVRARGGGR